eukprot:NODE_225_length_2256_cov_57.223109_g219_i0.p1 GENE.NODE_225_length_2256_cov_57.223109_g219_i0~~NODE_225_length_2256_cov_57.223109_g219_i0.p1  ORF type:complete len:306 (+),score=55.84 NODE_225_length_2256_cov_57.223109_g219_i0:1279-2196(+)
MQGTGSGTGRAVPPSSTTIIVTGLQPQSYVARVRARSSRGYSHWSRSSAIVVLQRADHAGRADTVGGTRCSYFLQCQEFIAANVPTAQVNEFAVCYCAECHRARGDKLLYHRGKPPSKYALPIGWSRFGLKQHSGRTESLGKSGTDDPLSSVFSDWHVCYHGTSLQALLKILDTGFLAPAGTTLNGGDTVQVVDGHIKKPFQRYNKHTQKNEDFDPNQVFVSPSIRYCAWRSIYCKPIHWHGRTYKVALRCRIKPTTYGIGQQTVLKSEDAGVLIHPEAFRNEELEWYSKAVSNILITDILVHYE